MNCASSSPLLERGDTRHGLLVSMGACSASRFRLPPFLTDDDYENLRWYLEDYMDLPDGGAVTRAAAH